MRLSIFQLIIISLFTISEAITPRQFISISQGNGNLNEAVACKEAGDGIADDEDGRCQDLRILGQELVSSGASNAIFAIDQFYARLKSYFDKDKFYAQRFVAHTDDLRQDFEDLEIKAREKAWAEFNMARFLFQVMVDSARYLNCYSEINLSGHELVFWAVETYARAVAMFNIEGVIDREIRNHAEKLKRLNQTLDALDYQFSLLENAPFLIRLMFKDQWTRATRIVEVLQRQIDETAKFVPET
ncbi:hypothetical protein OY671_002072 [Metschnikowia pulcherrima]|nr:hypothetical protein OY671_002072 [Metschnikowia pulcherrima]